MSHKGNPLTEARVIGFDNSGVPTRVTNTLPLPVESTLNPNLLNGVGEQSVAISCPVIQVSFPYNLNSQQVTSFGGNLATVTQDDDKAIITTGTETDAFGLISTRELLKAAPGHGIMAEVACEFGAGVANTEQIAGWGGLNDGAFFGFLGTAFGVLLRRGGNLEVRTLTVTTASSTAEDITITLNGEAKTDISVTASGDATITAREISLNNYSALGGGFGATAFGNTVFFIALTKGPQSGTYSLSGATTAVGSFVQDIVGLAPVDTWIAQTAWNVDKMDGTGVSEVTLDPTKGNSYRIHYTMGFGPVSFSILTELDNIYQDVHIHSSSNIGSSTTTFNPTAAMFVDARSKGSTTSLTMKVVYMAGFLQGEVDGIGVTETADAVAEPTTTNEIPILTVLNKRIFQGKLNRVSIEPQSLTLSTLLNNGFATFRLYIRANPETGTSYTDVDTNVSVMQFDTDSTTFTNVLGRKIDSFVLHQNDSGVIDLKSMNVIISPGQTLMITAQASKANANNEVAAALNWKERN